MPSIKPPSGPSFSHNPEMNQTSFDTAPPTTLPKTIPPDASHPNKAEQAKHIEAQALSSSVIHETANLFDKNNNPKKFAALIAAVMVISQE